MQETLKSWANDRGYRVAWGTLDVVRQARAEILARRAAGELDEALFHGELEVLASGDGGGPLDTVVMVAKPRPAHRVGFELDGSRLDAVLPPTYVRYRATFEEVRQDLAAHGLPGARIEQLTAPLKAVAARLGLVRYGRNNITYAEGIGSYLQLCGYVTDAPLPLPEKPAGETPAFLDECDDCHACRSVCPTAAIGEERELICAERCLTYANENPGEWRDWVPARAHNCLLGCLLCQRVCPVNPKLRVEATGLSFSTEETRLLLTGGDTGDDRTETGISSKLAWLGQPSAEPVLGRNLRALLRKGGQFPILAPSPNMPPCFPQLVAGRGGRKWG